MNIKVERKIDMYDKIYITSIDNVIHVYIMCYTSTSTHIGQLSLETMLSSRALTIAFPETVIND